MCLKPLDSYWKRRWRECDRERRRLQADANCERGFHDAAEKELDEMHDVAWKQGIAIRAYQKEIEALRKQVEQLGRDLAVKTREAELLDELWKEVKR